jgi:hypothetical protein
VQEGPGQGQALALPRREPHRAGVGPVRHGEPLEQLHDPGVRIVEVTRRRREPEILPGRQAIVEAGVLGQDPGAAAHAVALGGRIQPEDGGRPVVGREDSVEQADRGRLPRAVGSEEGQHLARAGVEGQAVERHLVAEPAAERVGGDGGAVVGGHLHTAPSGAPPSRLNRSGDAAGRGIGGEGVAVVHWRR